MAHTGIIHMVAHRARTDGIYGSFIVKDAIPEMDLEDMYEEHTLLLMDWIKDTSRDIGQLIAT